MIPGIPLGSYEDMEKFELYHPRHPPRLVRHGEIRVGRGHETQPRLRPEHFGGRGGGWPTVSDQLDRAPLGLPGRRSGELVLSCMR